MKLNKLVMSGLLVFLFAGVNAQVFVGGDVRFNTGVDKTETAVSTNKTSNYSLGISPMAGKFLSDDLAVGLALDLNFSQDKSDVVTDTRTRNHTIGLKPFVRYYAVRWNKFSVYGQGEIQLLFTGTKYKNGNVTTDGPKSTTIGLNCSPGLAYDINDRISLETTINILSFNLSYAVNKNGTTTDRITSFGFGAGTDNIVRVGNITIGAIYRF